VPGFENFPPAFIFDTEDGTHLRVEFQRRPRQRRACGRQFRIGRGCTRASRSAPTSMGLTFYATNFNAGTIEVFDNHFAPATTDGKFVDQHVAGRFSHRSEFRTSTGDLWVTYAKQDRGQT